MISRARARVCVRSFVRSRPLVYLFIARSCNVAPRATMDDDNNGVSPSSAATCHIRVAHRQVEPLRGHAERIAKLFGVKLLLPTTTTTTYQGGGATETTLLRCYSPRGPNASEPLLVPLRILSGCAADAGGGGSRADTMCEIAVGVQVSRVRDDVTYAPFFLLVFSSYLPPPPRRSPRSFLFVFFSPLFFRLATSARSPADGSSTFLSSHFCLRVV